MPRKFKSAAEELAFWGALKSGDPTAIAAAKEKAAARDIDVSGKPTQPKSEEPQIPVIKTAEQPKVPQAPITTEQLIPQCPTTAEIPKVAEAIPTGGILPELGGAISATGLFNKIKTGQELTTEEESQIEQLSLTQPDFDLIKRGDANIKVLSQLIEGLPIFGKLRWRGPGISISIADLAGTSPGTKVSRLMKLIETTGGNMQEEIIKFQTTGDPFWLSSALEKQDKFLELERTLKLIAIQSPEVQGNPELMDEINQKIAAIKRNTLALNW